MGSANRSAQTCVIESQNAHHRARSRRHDHDARRPAARAGRPHEPHPAPPVGQGRDSTQPHPATPFGCGRLPRHHRLRRDRRAADVRTPFSRITTSSCSVCGARRRAASCAGSPSSSTSSCPSSPAAKSTMTRWRRSAAPAGRASRTRGTGRPSAGCPATSRYVEKLATPDVTIADMVGDIDPIKAARGGFQLSDELTMHYGLLPRANRGIFAINELPDLAGKIQVGLFNILQEGDVQIKGYPVRLPLDLLLVFTANPEDYTARGKIITPLKDRIGSEIRTHYPATREQRARHHGAGSLDHRRRLPDRRTGLRAGHRGRDRLPGARRSTDRQTVGCEPAAADHVPRKRRVERGTTGAARE